MKKILSFVLSLFIGISAFAQTVAVLGFESDNFCIEERTGMMSDLLTDELVGLPHITVVERKHIDKVVGDGERIDVYTLGGQRLATGIDARQLNTLKSGVYVVKGRKVMVK